MIQCECGERASLVRGAEVYPHRRDLAHLYFWKCSCGRFVGCHKGTTRPLGRPADAETRRARSAAHAAFDPLWRDPERRRFKTRRQAYRWLAEALGIDEDDCHMGEMSAENARRVIDAVDALLNP